MLNLEEYPLQSVNHLQMASNGLRKPISPKWPPVRHAESRRGQEQLTKFFRQYPVYDLLFLDAFVDLHSPIDRNSFLRSARGTVFEWYAYWSLLRSQFRDKVLLSPDETLRFFGTSSSRKINHSPGTSHGIKGITVPDGLLLREAESSWQLEAVIDYKLGHLRDSSQSVSYNRLVNHYRRVLAQPGDDSHRSGAIISECCPDLCLKPLIANPKLRLIYITPDDIPGLPKNQIPFDRRFFEGNVNPTATTLYQDMHRYMRWYT